MQGDQNKQKRWEELEAKINSAISEALPSSAEEYASRRIRVLKKYQPPAMPSILEEKRNRLDLIQSQKPTHQTIRTQVHGSSPLKQNLNFQVKTSSELPKDQTISQADKLIQSAKKFINSANEEKQKKVETSSLFNNPVPMKTTSLFGSAPITGLFANIPKPIPTAPLFKPIVQNTVPQPDNPFAKPGINSSLFANPKLAPTKTEQPKPVSNLFSSPVEKKPQTFFLNMLPCKANVNTSETKQVEKEPEEKPKAMQGIFSTKPAAQSGLGLFNQGIFPKKQVEQKPVQVLPQSVVEQQPIKPAPNISLFGANSLQNNKSLFSNPTQKAQENTLSTSEQPRKSIFGNPHKETPALASQNKEKGQTATVPPLFSKIFPPGASLFSMKQPTSNVEESNRINPFKKKPVTEATTTEANPVINPISQPKPQTSLFSGNPINGLFANATTTNPSLFGSSIEGGAKQNPFSSSAGTSIFAPSSSIFQGSTGVPSNPFQNTNVIASFKPAEQDGEGEDDAGELYEQESEGVQGEMAFQYKSEFQVIAKFECELFIRNSEESIKDVIASIQKRTTNNKFHIFIRQKKTKREVYQGEFVSKTACTILSNRTNMRIGPILHIFKGKVVLDLVRIKFREASDSDKFQAEVLKLNQ